MRGDARHERVLPLVESERRQVLAGQVRGAIFDYRSNLVPFLDRRQHLAREQHIANGVLTAFTGKDEEDGGKHRVVVEH